MNDLDYDYDYDLTFIHHNVIPINISIDIKDKASPCIIFKHKTFCKDKDSFRVTLVSIRYMGDYSEQLCNRLVLLLSHLHPQINHNVLP